MTVIVHRGTNQIGGCITEIRTESARIFVDMGADLPDWQWNTKTELGIEGVTVGMADCDAVFITHYHSDHVGRYGEVLADIPIYMGEAAREIFFAVDERLGGGGGPRILEFKTFRPLDKIVIKDITVTPILTDHSAFDSYMFLIESGGKKILHTGDFRLHGLRGKSVFPALREHVGEVDLLITEGTMLSRDNKVRMSESDMQFFVKKIISHYKYIFILCASTNIDRMAAVYNAVPPGKYFVCDEYQKGILDIVTRYSSEVSPAYNFKKVHTYGSNLDEKLRERGFCMLVRCGEYFSKIMRKFPDAVFLYSMWEGYWLGKNPSEAVARLTEEFPFQPFHTGGHATKAELEAVCGVVNPRVGVVPIHSEAPGALVADCPVILLENGEEFSF